ncbi:hypothetical protein SVIOM342S_01396 [Streptomyces violaceorubidus]
MAAVGANQNVSRRCPLSGDNAAADAAVAGSCATIVVTHGATLGVVEPPVPDRRSGKETQVKGTAKP